MPCIVKTGVKAHDDTCLQAKMTRQVAVAAAANQAAVTAAEVTYYRGVKASALGNGPSDRPRWRCGHLTQLRDGRTDETPLARHRALRVAACPGVGAGAGQSRRYDRPWHPRSPRRPATSQPGRRPLRLRPRRETVHVFLRVRGHVRRRDGRSGCKPNDYQSRYRNGHLHLWCRGGAGVPSPSLVVLFNPCLPANAANTSIVVSMPSLGTGNINAIVSISKSAHYFPTL